MLAKQGRLWLLGVVGLIILFVVYSIAVGVPIKKVGIPGLFDIEFAGEEEGIVNKDKLADMSTAERESSQTKLEEQVRQLTEKITQMQTEGGTPGAGEGVPVDLPEPSDRPATTSELVNVSGNWLDAEGVGYSFRQFGNYVTFQEFIPQYGVTAVGEGTISGRTINLSIATVLGGRATAVLEISPDGQRLNGTATDLVFGQTMEIKLHR